MADKAAAAGLGIFVGFGILSFAIQKMGSWLSEAPPPSDPPDPADPADPPDPPSPEFEEPWRMVDWSEKHKLEQKLRNFKVSNPDVKQVKILVMGPVGAGKSSFITSVNNIFQGRITSEALVNAVSGKSFTKVFKSHYIEGEDGRPLAFLFNDVMGLEVEQGSGAHEQDVIKALQGFIQEGYRFNPESSVSMDDQRYRSNPELKDQIFCLVYVLPADKVSIMDPKVFEKMRHIREQATELYLPQVIIMTKPDDVCPLVKINLRKIYTSKRIKDKMQECSNLLGVPMNHIFPVKNYHEEIDTDNNTDVLILKALDQIVNIANDSLKKKRSDSGDSSEEIVLKYKDYPVSMEVTHIASGGPHPERKKSTVKPLLQRKDSASTESKSSEAVAEWLTNAQLQFYTTNFLNAGYDLQTISMMESEDLTAIGVKKLVDRQKIQSEIKKLNFPDWTPKEKPTSLPEWLSLIGLSQYYQTLVQNGYGNMDFVSNITLEDLQELGITKQGHQKMFMVAINSLGELTKKDLLKNQIDENTGSKETTAAKTPPAPLPRKNIKHNSSCNKGQRVGTQPVQIFTHPEEHTSMDSPTQFCTTTHANLKTVSPQSNSHVHPVSLPFLSPEGTAEVNNSQVTTQSVKITSPQARRGFYDCFSPTEDLDKDATFDNRHHDLVCTGPYTEGRLSECDVQSTQPGSSVRELAAKLQQSKLRDGADATSKSYLQPSPSVLDRTALSEVSKNPKPLENRAVADDPETLQTTKNVSDLIKLYEKGESSSNSRTTLRGSNSSKQGVAESAIPRHLPRDQRHSDFLNQSQTQHRRL